MKTRLYGIALGLVLVGGSCKKDSDDLGPDTCAQTGQRADALAQVATTYGTNPTKANCEAYRKAVNDYLDAASKCPTVSERDITNARNSVNALNCQ